MNHQTFITRSAEGVRAFCTCSWEEWVEDEPVAVVANRDHVLESLGPRVVNPAR